VLQGKQPESLESRALAEVLIVHPVIICARQLDGPITADDAAKRQTVRRIEHGAGQADIFHEFDPTLSADFREGAGRESVGIGCMEMVIGRIGSPADSETAPISMRRA